MKYRIEHRPNPNFALVHVDQKLIHGCCLNFKMCNKELRKKKFEEEAVNEDGLMNFCEVVSKLEGMEENIGIKRYQIALVKASDLFSWDDILPHVVCAMQAFVADNGVIHESVPPCWPTQAELDRSASEIRTDF